MTGYPGPLLIPPAPFSSPKRGGEGGEKAGVEAGGEAARLNPQFPLPAPRSGSEARMIR